MSLNVLDILINEVATVLGISPDEVKQKFTTEELQELLDNSLCEPVDESGPAMDSLDIPCEDTGTPLDLPQISEEDLNSFDALIDEAEKESENKGKSIKKCVDDVETINNEIQKDIDEYNDLNTLLQKLIEYRDNYAPIAIYFEERINEANKIIFAFKPIIEQLREYERQKRAKQNEIVTLDSKIKAVKDQYKNTALPQTASDLIKAYEDQKKIVYGEIDVLTDLIVKQEKILSDEEKKFPIFDDLNFKEAISNIGGQSESYYLNKFLNNLFSGLNSLSEFNNDLRNYAEGLSVFGRTNIQNLTFQELINQPTIKFSLDFMRLNYIPTQKEKFDRSTGTRTILDIQFPIKTSKYLQKNNFFNTDLNVRIGELDVPQYRDPFGIIYTGYYNLFKDPVNNFFSINERGLTDNSNLIDPKFGSNPGAAEKKENGKNYWISDLDKMSAFYQEFDARFEIRKEEKRQQVITPAQASLRGKIRPIAKNDVTNLLALGGVNKYLITDRKGKLLNTIISKIQEDYTTFVGRLNTLDLEISRIRKRVEELKPNPNKVKSKLKQFSPDCFGDIDKQVTDCGDTKSVLGSDPFFTKTIGGIDPTLPNFTQLCYWIEFSKMATLMGLLPIPNIPNFTELRYWPVGIIIPTPVTIIKIPLPIIWLPLVCISTPLGVIVLFLTVNGLFISPVVFFVSSKGFKQFIITVRGSSKKFGYDSEDQSVKPQIQLPVAILAAKEKAERLIRESSSGKLFNLTSKERDAYLSNSNILNNAEAEAKQKGNQYKLNRIKKEKENLNKSISNLGPLEKLQDMLNTNLETADDVIDDVKRAVLQRINDLGKPILSSSNDLKTKILNRRELLYSNLIKALERNDVDEAAKIRNSLSIEGISYSQKVDALKKDVTAYFNKIKFPKINIPKDRSKLEPKKNAIIEFLIMIKDYASTYKTQFVPKEHLVVKTWMATNLAKIKPKLKQEGNSQVGTGNRFDVTSDLDKIKSYLLSVNSSVIKAASGIGDKVDYTKQKEEIANLEKQRDSETDPIKKKKLSQKVIGAKNKLSDAFENEFIQQTFALTPAVIAALNGFKVDFNPFAPCCKKNEFKLDLSAIGPSLAVLNSASGILSSEISSLTPDKLKSLIGGKNKISVNELLTVYLSIINKKIPTSLKIPNPSLSLVTFAATFSGIFLSLIEPKAPIAALQPKFPVSIPIDLNLLKPVLLPLLLKFIDDILPDGPRSPKFNISDLDGKKDIPSNTSPTQLANSISSETGNPPISISGANSTFDSNIKIVDCYPESEEVVLGDGEPQKSNQESLSAVNDITKGKENIHEISNVIITTKKDVFMQFQHIDIDFLTINPNDILAIITNFIEAKLDDLKNLLDPFYKILGIIKTAKNQNLNLIEFAQFKIPPYGPPTEIAFNAITVAKMAAPKAAIFKVMDADKAMDLAKQLESSLKPIMSTPLPYLAVAAAGAVDSILPSIKKLNVDPSTASVSTSDLKPATFALRAIHPMLNQDDLPPWERLTLKNLLFILFLDEFLSNSADQVGFFRAYL